MDKISTIRFDLEEQLVRCWTILDDLRDVQDPYVQALRNVYQVHFEKMWSTFENLCYETRPKSEPSKYNDKHEFQYNGYKVKDYPESLTIEKIKSQKYQMDEK